MKKWLKTKQGLAVSVIVIAFLIFLVLGFIQQQTVS